MTRNEGIAAICTTTVMHRPDCTRDLAERTALPSVPTVLGASSIAGRTNSTVRCPSTAIDQCLQLSLFLAPSLP